VVVEALAVTRRAIAVLVALLGGALAVLLWTRAPDPVPEGPTRDGLVPYAPDGVRAIEIWQGTEEIRLERDEHETWWVSGPPRGEADPERVDAWLRALAAIEVRRVVTDRPAAEEQPFGLDHPAGRVILRGADASPVLRIDLGGESPIGDERYVRDASGTVLLVSNRIAGLLSRRAGSFLQRRFVPVDPAAVRGVLVHGGRSTLRLERRQEQWWITEPFEDLADDDAVADLLLALSALSAGKLLDAEEIDLARGAFDEAVAIAVDLAGAGVRTIEIGAPAGPGRWFARRVGDDRFWGVVDGASVRGLAREPDDLRDRRLARFSRAAVEGIRIESGGEILALDRGSGHTWRTRDGEATVDGETVAAFLDRLRRLRARGFGGGGGRGGARLAEIVVSGASGELGRITLERFGGASDLLVARSSWRPGGIFTVDADFLEVVPMTVDDLRAPLEGAAPGERRG
jgi:hypothetical protein